MRHLLEAGFTVFGYDVSAERLQSFRQAGGHVAELATEVVERSDVVLTELNRSPVACGLFFGVAFMFLLRDEGEGIDSPRDDGQRKVSHVVNLLDAH
jgi:3-hydroxyisobutyrate dehydrogenase-like beta-hydroxyacid dehydrogenase